jgi:succinyl-CoA synthetase alpha subunit
VALIAGVHAVPGQIMGHAGAFALPGEPSASTKIEALETSGATIINHPSRFGPVLKGLLASPKRHQADLASLTSTRSQSRAMHTSVRRPSSLDTGNLSPIDQRRTLYISQSAAADLLHRHGITLSRESILGTPRFLAISINRTSRSPCIIASPSEDLTKARTFDLDYLQAATDLPIPAIAAALGLEESSIPPLGALLSSLVALFKAKEAFLLETRIISTPQGVAVRHAHFGFDDAAHRSGGRQADIHSSGPVGADADGIVYIKLPGGNIGTLVNGAGLAMNTVDALADAGGRAANFLDTGGKATSETVKRSFEIVLRDERVKVRGPSLTPGLQSARKC